MHERTESPNTSPQAVELNPSCLGQARFNRPGTGPKYKSTEPGSIFTILRISFIVCTLRSADAKSGKVVQKISCSWYTCKCPNTTTRSPILVDIGPKACTLVARGQTWQGYASCLKKTQLVDSLEIPTSLQQCSGSPAVE